jgi:lipopolysaccharide exporter
VAFPVYAQTWRVAPGAIFDVYYKVRRIPSVLYAFGCGGLIGGASLLVAVLYDPRYAQASTYVAFLAFASALRLPNFAAAELMTAIGRIKATLHVNVARVIWLALAIPLGFVEFGPLGVVAAVGLMEVPAMLYSWFVLKSVGVLDFWRELEFLAAVAAGVLTGYLASITMFRFFPGL